MSLYKQLKHIQISAFTIVVVYAFFAGLWVLLSERAVELTFSDPDTVVKVSKAKDEGFVAITSLLLNFSIRRLIGQLMLMHQHEQQQPPPILTSIAESSADAIFAKDKEGRYLLVNNAAAQFMGRPTESILKQDDRAIFPLEQAEQLIDIDRRIMETGQTETNEETLQTAVGERVFLATKGPLRDAEGMVFGTFGISRDITERKLIAEKIQRKEEKLRLLFEHSPVALAMFDRDMHYLAANQRWIEVFSLDKRNIIGLLHYDVFPEIGAELKNIHQRVLSGEAMTIDTKLFERADGRVQWLRWEMQPWIKANHSIGGIVIFAEDVTERINTETEIRHHNEELEHFNRASVNRELDMIALKERINALSVELGRAPPYDLSVFDISAGQDRQ